MSPICSLFLITVPANGRRSKKGQDAKQNGKSIALPWGIRNWEEQSDNDAQKSTSKVDSQRGKRGGGRTHGWDAANKTWAWIVSEQNATKLTVSFVLADLVEMLLPVTFLRLGVIVPGSNHAVRLFFQKLTPEHCVRRRTQLCARRFVLCANLFVWSCWLQLLLYVCSVGNACVLLACGSMMSRRFVLVECWSTWVNLHVCAF